MTKIRTTPMTAEEIKNLPNGVQVKINDMLKSYTLVQVIFSNGTYQFSPSSLAPENNGASDFKHFGHITIDQIYSDGERLINFFNKFKRYPQNYKGHRDETLITILTNENISFEGILIDGNIIIKTIV